MRENEERRDNASLAAGNAGSSAAGGRPRLRLSQKGRGSARQPGVSFRPRRGFEIVSPDASIRWRIGPSGVVEYSEDAGATWEATPTGVGTDLLAGASPSGTVCWVVGSRGNRAADDRRQAVAAPDVPTGGGPRRRSGNRCAHRHRDGHGRPALHNPRRGNDLEVIL